MTRLIIYLTLLIAAPCYGGYAAVVADQVPAFVVVHGVSGDESRPNPRLQDRHPAHYCAPDNYDRSAADPARRTEVIRSDSGTLSKSQVLAICPTALDAKYRRLWDCAHSYEQQYISGVGLSILSIGVSQGKAKARAAAAWTQALWGEYYARKASIDLETEPSCDFTAVGPMPYSVTELSQEVWQ